MTLGQCPLANVDVHQWKTNEKFSRCNQHREQVIEWIKENNPSLIIASDSPISTFQRLMSKNKGDEALREIRVGMTDTYSELKKLDIDLIHLEPPPRINCFFEKKKDPSQCKSNEGTKFERNLSLEKISIAKEFGFQVVDLVYWVCSPELVCPNQINGILVKVDSGHFTGNFSRKIGIILKRQIQSLIK